MRRTSKKVKFERKMITNNGEKVIKRRSGLGVLMVAFSVILSLVMFFGYSKYILADDFDDFDDGFFDDFDTGGSSSGGAAVAAPSGDMGSGSSGVKDNFDLSEAEISKFEVASAYQVKYWGDDPADDKNHKDPFKPLIVKKIKIRKHITEKGGQKIEEQIIPPLDLKLVGVIKAGDRKMGMITLDGKYMELFEGDEDPQGKFKVKTINDDSVLIISYHRHGELRTLTLGGK